MTSGRNVSKRRVAAIAVVAAAVGALVLAGSSLARPAAACSFCGKNLIKNPGAEGRPGQNATGETGNVPHWTSIAGQFGAAAYTGFGVGWFTATSQGPEGQGQELLLRWYDDSRDQREGDHRPADDQAACSGGTSQGHVQRLARELQLRHRVGAGRVHGRVGEGRSRRSGSARTRRSAAGTCRFAPAAPPCRRARKSVTIVVTFTDHANYNLAGADDLSLVLS